MKKLRKNIDWVVLISFISIIYLGGWQAEVFGFIQRGILVTGLFNASGENEENENVAANLNFTLSDEKGNKIQIKDYEGKTIFINFWATWCPPCRAEMPSIQALYSKLMQNPNILFLTISQDEDEQKAVKYMGKQSIQLPLYFLTSELPTEFSHQSIPSTFVISPEGNIVYQHEGMANYDTEEFKTFLEEL
ncbi:TlpA disulfide reductase family protein [Catalinimonas sp. 4WD22]|uniref:TlpA family protein disulfide reductase n=1 Tax=Catalinimonas locisalis TaxID=3133978 RepID=UPI003101355B